MDSVPPTSEAPLHFDPAWIYTFRVLLSRSTGSHVFLLDGPGGWAMPHFISPEHDLRAVGPLQRLLRCQLGCPATVLRCVAVDRSRADARRVEAVFAAEVSDPAWQPPPDGRWVGPTELATLPLTLPEQRPLLDAWLRQEAEAAHNADAHPWVAPGWHAAAATWIDRRLAELRAGPALAIEQVRSWDLSCVLRIRTPTETVILKALPPAYRPELALTRALSARFPDHLPVVLAADDERGWMLLSDAGPLMDNDDIAQWDAAIGLLARMHIASSTGVEALLAAGCLDQRLDQLAAQIDRLLADAVVRTLLDEDDYRRLRAIAPWLKRRCAQLAAAGVPPTLVHGDLHTGNIAVRHGQLVFFDWGDGCISHPFFDLFALLDEDYFPRGTPAVGERLRERYLRAWGGIASTSTLRAVLKLAQPLAALRYTIGCQRCFGSADALWRAELAPTLRACVRTLLEQTPEDVQEG